MSWIVPKSPQQTLELLVERKLLDLETPEKSLLRAKPLGLVEHGAGIKFPEGGDTEQAWLAFIEDYGRIVRGKYEPSQQGRPASPITSWRTGLHLRITKFQPAQADQLVTVTLHRETRPGVWDQKPFAFAESRVSEAGLSWGNTLSVRLTSKAFAAIDPSSPPDAASLIPLGTYQIRIWDGAAVAVITSLESPSPSQLQPIAALPLSAPWAAGHAATRTLSLDEISPKTEK